MGIKCPLCKTVAVEFTTALTQEANTTHISRLYQCRKCGLMFSSDYQRDRLSLYGENYMVWGKSEEHAAPLVAEAKREAFRRQLSVLLNYIDPKGKTFLDIGTGKGYLLDVASQLGFKCYGVEPSHYAGGEVAQRYPNRIVIGTLQDAHYQDCKFDAIAMTDVIEHISDPHTLLREVRRIIAPGGLLFIITPNSSSISRKLLGKRWFQYKYEHVLYWNKKSLEHLLGDYQFTVVEIRNNKKTFNLLYYYHYFQKYSLVGIRKLFLQVYRLTPYSIKKKYFPNPITGELLLIAKLRR